ncbi:aminotransferase class IV [Pollutibacter soli]|uniref:aminotransferase class IV n=1 Tax=Pollutibacter soli TaxID=3034157 RepID=UPI003013595A
MSKNFSFVNDEFVDTDNAKIGIKDLGLQRGYGIFDFLKTVNDHPLHLEDHLDRFYKSAETMRLPVPYNREELTDIISQLMRKNKLPDSGIRINLTGGDSDDGYTITRPNLVISQSFLRYNPEIFDRGWKITTFEYQRQFPDVKTIDYLNAVWLQPQVKAAGADDVLYFYNDELRECPRTNIFIVTRDGIALTPANHVLPGITRKQLLGLKEFQVDEAVLTIDMLNDAAEVFITSTTKLIIPVLAVDGRTIGNGQPGPVTRDLYAALKKIQYS